MLSLLQKEIKTFKTLLDCKNVGEFEKTLTIFSTKFFTTKPLLTLKKRYQLGLLSKTKEKWHEVNHTRYEHSLGIVAKCIIVGDIINSRSGNKCLTKIDIKELIVAAAIHDTGHLPISHAAERAVLSIPTYKTGRTHEERIIPRLLSDRDDYYFEIKNLIYEWGLSKDSIYRIAFLVDDEFTDFYLKKNKIKFDLNLKPKKAVSQLLSSDLDLDRLDYILRDSLKLNYKPVLQIQNNLARYVYGLSLIETKIIENSYYKNENLELCLSDEYIEEAFYLLISRVLLYRFVYFSEEVRSFEATFTYLIGELLQKSSINIFELMTIGDDEFLLKYLKYYVDKISDNKSKESLEKEYFKGIINDKVSRFERFKSISIDEIKNPRLKQEFLNNINSREYLKHLKDFILLEVKKAGKVKKIHIDEDVLLLDVFTLKTGGGEFLVYNNKENKIQTLKNFMNGSNMHKLCSENRLDVYVQREVGEPCRKVIMETLTKIINSYS
jgi:HD superfamily phosphohydrolase